MDHPSPPQQLPISARWCLTSQRCIDLEVARTPEQQRLGLMQRPRLPALRGMWFPFDQPRPLSFWMFNTIAPSTCCFCVAARYCPRKVPVCPSLPCPSYGPDQPSDGVVELSAGEADLLGIQPGDLAKIETIQ